MTVHIQFDPVVLSLNGEPPLSAELVERAAVSSLEGRGTHQDIGLTVVITADETVHSLNQEYLGVDATTDVLSFPAGEVDPETGTLYLGDVVLSYPQAEKQAAASGHDVEAEIQLLVVHGVLHLLGYDHAEAAEKADMWAVQAEILTAIACPARISW